MVADSAVDWLVGEVLPDEVICHSNDVQLDMKVQRVHCATI